MQKILTLTLVTAIAAVPTLAREIDKTRPERVGMSSERLERVEAMNASYVEQGKIAGLLTAVLRDGKIVHQSAVGTKGIDDDRPLEMDDLFRIYSMTKPITAVAAMQLYERGLFHLTDPVAKFVPELADVKVLKDGELHDVTSPMTMQDLLAHTTGMSYGFNPRDPVDEQYLEADLWSAKDLDDFAARVGKLPLAFQPGGRWHYSIAVDITGVVVERLSGQPFDEYLKEHIFDPLDMVDTFFEVPADKVDRLLPNHTRDPETGEISVLDTDNAPEAAGELLAECRAMCDYTDVTLYSGGGGLVSTLRDYVRFAEAVRNGGQLQGVRILSPKTIKFMSRNHLPASLAAQGGSGEQPLLVGGALNGFGFGLGFGVVTDATEQGVMGSEGQYYWGGAAGTVFWIDPVEDIVVVSMQQLMGGWPSYRPDLRVATYQAILESRE